ncbi:M20/M25/M40 family metallo-hydrolase [Aestuariibacter halophilus]|uniref:Carboxypeptidase Q n=1 Tax=Fluctibacter halophilus TaxID=226011 RepID=A0ABS8G3Q6_9ALTE|nr:M20/M25/M40 family metallo-hydrolase [Aestuariibacter halophilus]MCC2615224.1 M20/M25/M40 family metallo-hydrolase [Aestuariibacter halophilus]
MQRLHALSTLLMVGLLHSPLSLAATSVADMRDTLDQLKATSTASELAYELTESLTTEVGPRMVGTPGSDKAIDWAVAKMKTLGFDKVWIEESQADLWTRGDTNAQLTAPYPHKLVALALGGSVGTDGKTLTGDIVRFETLDDLKAAAPGSLNGKIAYVAYRMERHIDGHGYGKAVGARVSGAAVAAEKGAIAFVMRSVGTDDNRLAHTGVMRYKDGIRKIPAVAVSNPDADLMDNALKRGQPVTFSLQLGASGPTGKTVRIANVLGEITGTTNPDEFVLLGAHLDSWDVGTGAIDDGIGVGMVMAAAHHIGQLKQRPARSVRVLLFAAEEIGLIGAKDYVARHGDLKNHVIGAEWDFGNGNIYELAPGVGPSSLNAIRDFAAYLTPMGISLASTNDAKGQSDMSLLGEAGMPAVNFEPDGSDYFDYHHTENDTLDKVNREALVNNTTVYTLFAYFAAQSGVDFRQ